MSTDIKFAVIHSFFDNPLEVWVKWNLPFLPRAGEDVNGWVWIDKNLRREDIMDNLTTEGKRNLAQWNGDLSDWLYEVGIVAGTVSSVSYYEKKDKKGEIYAIVWLKEDE